MTGSRGPQQLIEAYRDGARLLRDAIDGLDPEALRAKPIPGKWSSLQVACHIVDSDQFMCDRIKRTIATDKPVLIGVESAEYLGPLHYDDRDLDLDLRLLTVQREQLAADIERLPDTAWQRTAHHSENGTQTLLELFDHAVDHLESHVIAICEKRRALGL